MGFRQIRIEGERVADLVEDPPELRRTTLIEKTHRVCVLPPHQPNVRERRVSPGEFRLKGGCPDEILAQPVRKQRVRRVVAPMLKRQLGDGFFRHG